MEAQVRAVLFDVTGTLIEPRADVGKSYSRIASRHGVEIPGARLDQKFRCALRDWPEQFFPNLSPLERAAAERERWRGLVRQTFETAGAPFNWPSFDEFFDEVFMFFERKEAWRIRPHVLTSLRAARQLRLRMGIVSNFDYRLPGLLQELGIIGFFDTIVYPSQCGYGKPDSKIFLMALREVETEARACLFVGHDPVRDLAPARSLGMRTLDVSEASHKMPAQIERLAKLVQ